MKKPLLRVVVIDDEPDARNFLRHTIESNCPLLAVKGEADSVRKGIREIQRLNPDLVFLDIELSDGSGFDVLTAFPERSFKVAIVSAHNHALRAYKHRVAHYLSKPVITQDIVAFCNELCNADSEHSPPAPVPSPTLRFSAAKGAVFVQTDNICGAVSDDRFASLLLATGEKLFVAHNLSELEHMLPAGQFLRVHQSHLVRRNDIVRVIKSEPLILILRNKHQAPVSRRNRKWVLQELGI